MESKQTAIDWLAERVGHNSLMSLADYYEILEQALAIEKEQIIDAFQEGKWDWHAKINEGKESKDPSEYYNETYKK